MLGKIHEYLKNIVKQFAVLGVVDEHCTALLRDVEDFMRAGSAKATELQHDRPNPVL